MILVVNDCETIANNVKGLIEFMDSPRVCIATPTEWRERLGKNRLEALFVGSDLGADDKKALLDSIGKIDPNVPIVLMNDMEPN